MKQITFTTNNANDFYFLFELGKRLNIHTIIKDNDHELNEKELTFMGMKLSEKSLAKDWENEDDEYWNNLLKQK